MPWMKTAIAFAVSASILWILFKRIDAGKVVYLIANSNFTLIILAIFISLSVNIFLGAVKWRSILSGLKYNLSFREVFYIRSGCLPLKVIFPLKSSELLKAFYLKRRDRIPAARAVSSIVLDKTLNILTLMIIFLIGLFATKIALPRVFALSALLLITLFLFSTSAQGIVTKIAGSMHPKMRELSAALLSAFSEIKIKKKLYLIVLSFVYQMSEIVNVYILFRAMSIPVPFVETLVFVPLIIIVNNIPITTLGLGTREGLVILLFRQYGPASALLGAGILVSFIEHVIPVLFGLFFVRYFIGGFTESEKRIPCKEILF